MYSETLEELAKKHKNNSSWHQIDEARLDIANFYYYGDNDEYVSRQMVADAVDLHHSTIVTYCRNFQDGLYDHLKPLTEEQHFVNYCLANPTVDIMVKVKKIKHAQDALIETQKLQKEMDDRELEIKKLLQLQKDSANSLQALAA